MDGVVAPRRGGGAYEPEAILGVSLLEVSTGERGGIPLLEGTGGGGPALAACP